MGNKREKKKISLAYNIVAHPMFLSKVSKSQGKNLLLTKNIFHEDRNFPPKIQIFSNKYIYFRILEVLSVVLTTYLSV